MDKSHHKTYLFQLDSEANSDNLFNSPLSPLLETSVVNMRKHGYDQCSDGTHDPRIGQQTPYQSG